MPTLIRWGEFVSHSGLRLPFKIDCDALDDDSMSAIALIIARRQRFGAVYGIPRGGVRLARALMPHATPDVSLPTLIVDDVLTTGASMEEARSNISGSVVGWVIFTRRRCPFWIDAVFTVDCELW